MSKSMKVTIPNYDSRNGWIDVEHIKEAQETPSYI